MIQSHSTLANWLRKYGSFDWDNQTPVSVRKTHEQRTMELEAEVKLLEKQKALLEIQAHIADKKDIFFDMMIDRHIDFRKNSASAQSITSAEQKKKT